MLDVFFLSYNEPYADTNYTRLLEFAPLARRVNGVKGFYEAHKRCAELSMTYNFYVVDADAWIVDDFNFNFVPSTAPGYYKPESDFLYVWSSINPINELTYGYGGVKLFPKMALLNKKITSIDFTTGVGLETKVMDEVSNITKFNYDEFYTWRAAFREVVKLSSGVILETLRDKFTDEQMLQFKQDNSRRVEAWLTLGEDKPYGEWAMLGAEQAVAFSKKYDNDQRALAYINDIEWLKNEFTKQYSQSSSESNS
jgi:hypothetical protein